jgi:small subunit ribosomal protein S2
MFHITNRWLGGTLTNFQTVERSVQRLKDLDSMFEDGTIERYSKKMRAMMRRERETLEREPGRPQEYEATAHGALHHRSGKENIAVREANRLRIPVIAASWTPTATRPH